MPWLPFFADEQDKRTLVQWLNAHPEIAFLIPDGPKRWKAVMRLDALSDGQILLWHIPSGPLSIYDAEYSPSRTRLVDDPWAGWSGKSQTDNSEVPSLDSQDVIIDLAVWARHVLHFEGSMTEDGTFSGRAVYAEDTLGLSTFGWLGNKYGSQIQGARDFWEQLKLWVHAEAKLLVQFPEERHESEEEVEHHEAFAFYAFAGAHQSLMAGAGYNANGFDLSEGLR